MIVRGNEFGQALMKALGLKPEEHIVSITITADATHGPSVLIKRWVRIVEADEIVNVLQEYELVPKD